MSVRVRFAPSPTGALHIGGVRTALYNYLFARKHGGTFILRIEDTDQTRYVPGAEEYIIESLKWVGLVPDEGVGFGGENGPYRQSDRKDIYRKHAHELVARGCAYYAFDTPEELETRRGAEENFTYNFKTRDSLRNSLSLPESTVNQLLDAGDPFVIRLKIEPNEDIKIQDLIRGEVTFNSSELDDKVLLKADGMPTYHLANIVDDHLMGITHVIRGEEWLPSTAHHVLLYRGFGWEETMPQFAHLPLIMKPEGNGKLSKRDGAKFGMPVFPMDWTQPESHEFFPGFRGAGFLPEALINFLALLGWHPGGDQEIFSVDELIAAFDLDHIHKSGARFDYDKAKWFNQKYIQALPNDELARLIQPHAEAAGYTTDLAYLEKVAGLMKERATFLHDFTREGYYLFEPPKNYDADTLAKKWSPEKRPVFQQLTSFIGSFEPFQAAELEQAVKNWMHENNQKPGDIMPLLRLALAGTMRGPAVFDMAAVLGKMETVARLERAAERWSPSLAPEHSKPTIAASPLLQKLLSASRESEILEFKAAKNDFGFDDLGKYFSALSNEANLKGIDVAYLVFGVRDKDHVVVGTAYRSSPQKMDSLKKEIADQTTNRITFRNIYEETLQEGRVVVFEIPAAPVGIPVAFQGHYYGRDGESLGALNIEEIERIRKQDISEDWSAAIVPDASVQDLDPDAIAKARANYKVKFPDKSADVDSWDDITFLNKAKITVKGKITRTAILLLGREESEHFINPAEAKIRWILKNTDGLDKDYQIESCPLLLAVDKVYAKIRNVKYRYMKPGTLFPEEMLQYEPFVIREAINNCIAHQDYTKGGRINVIEREDELVFSNLGEFIPGSVEKVVIENSPEEKYRNKFLATAMFNINMVDTVGGGIRKMFGHQQKRFFPLPEYDLNEGKIKVTIIGRVLDEDFARALAQKQDLTLLEIMMLDKVQKRKKLTIEEEKHLRRLGLIEGRKPNYYIAKELAGSVNQKAGYSKNRAFDKAYYLDLIQKAIREHGSLNRRDLDELLWKKLPDWMNDKQKRNKVTNLTSELRRNGVIENQGSLKFPVWVSVKKL